MSGGLSAFWSGGTFNDSGDVATMGSGKDTWGFHP